MAELSKDPSNRELLERIEALENENARLRAHIDDPLEGLRFRLDGATDDITRIYDLLSPVVDKLFPKFFETKKEIDEILRPGRVDPLTDTRPRDQMRQILAKSDFTPALKTASEETETYATSLAKAIIAGKEEPEEAARDMIRGLILHVVTCKGFIDSERNLIMVRSLILRGEWRIFQAIRELGHAEDKIDRPHMLLWRAMEKNPAFGGLVASTGSRFRFMMLSSPEALQGALQSATSHTEQFLGMRP